VDLEQLEMQIDRASQLRPLLPQRPQLHRFARVESSVHPR
jgi:hypothetical protein